MKSQPKEINTLKKYGKVFQSKCIAALLSDREFIEQTIDIINSEYFEADTHRWIIKVIVEYFSQYRNIPTREVFKVELEKIQDTLLKDTIVQHLKETYQYTSHSDLDYTKDTFIEFCRNQKLKNAIWESHLYLQEGNYEKIWQVINDASKAGLERKLGHEYLTEIEARHSAMARECISTGWDLIDLQLDGGLGKGELGFIVAPAGSGKSWFLSRLGAQAMAQGKNIMHFTMELNEMYVGLRYDSIFTGISFQEVRKNTDVVKSKISELKSKGLGKLYVKYFPTKAASASTLKMHVDRLQLIYGIKIDMIIVDYADLLRPIHIERGSNSYENAGNAYEELRGILGEFQVPGWTASQSNRSAHEEEIIDALDVADSYRKIMIGDFILSLSRTVYDKRQRTGRISIMKNRFGPDGFWYVCKFDTSNGKVELFDKDSIEGMELINIIKEEQSREKTIFKKTWNRVHGGPSSAIP